MSRSAATSLQATRVTWPLCAGTWTATCSRSCPTARATPLPRSSATSIRASCCSSPSAAPSTATTRARAETTLAGVQSPLISPSSSIVRTFTCIHSTHTHTREFGLWPFRVTVARRYHFKEVTRRAGNKRYCVRERALREMYCWYVAVVVIEIARSLGVLRRSVFLPFDCSLKYKMFSCT